ncbi:cytochrome C biosynthesis protein [Methanocella sp. CWC-04]|uniref:Cytochrome C biosynthesis protein n=1 Tax=Methanooceanicella nereidis TaxID=2052831 RepID=A0AAP2W6W1_9EURY|nr:tetratricopeptide repeat protein [Methanocella sp. CWC-04]MCD1294659.1 cytochrome C biosynthesis protein [Methanocella sp. CWC-04]
MTDKKKEKEVNVNSPNVSPVIVIPSHAECRLPDVGECSLDHKVALGLQMDEHNEKEIDDPEYIKAIDLYNKGRLDDAKKHFETVLANNPNIIEAHLLLGDIYERKMKFTDAIREYDHVLKLKPDDELTRFKRDTAVKQRARYLDKPV